MTTTTGLTSILAAIAERNGGILTPQVVVDEARSPEHPLHPRFTWDDSSAAEKCRRYEAAELIRQAKVTRITDTERGPVTVRAFLSVGEAAVTEDDEPSEPFTYIPIDSLSASAVAAILRQMERDVASLRRKYRDHRAALDQMLRDSLEESA